MESPKTFIEQTDGSKQRGTTHVDSQNQRQCKSGLHDARLIVMNQVKIVPFLESTFPV